MALSRRSFVLGGAGAVLLAACGDSGRSDPPDRAAGPGEDGLAIARVFAPRQAAGRALRLPIALVDIEGALLDDVPATVSVRHGPAGGELGPATVVRRHDQGIPTPYYPLQLTLAEPGSWVIEVDAAGSTATTTVTAVEPTEVPAVPGPGEALVPLATPTTADARGVDPICTRTPACPFHEQTLDEAMASGKPVAFVVSTPQFCQTAICGPVLELVIDEGERYGEAVSVVHAEVYTDSTARTTTEAVQAYGLVYEPAIFLARADGTIASRLDYTWDRVELSERFAEVMGS